MHIVFLTGEYPLLNPKHGGVGSFIKALATALVSNQVEVSVVGFYNIPKEINTTEDGIHIVGLPQSKWKLGKFIQNTKNILKKLEEINKIKPIDIVEGAELAFSFFPKKTPYKKVIRMHGGHHFFAVTLGKKPAFWRSYKEKNSFQKADLIIAVSNFVGTKTKELIGFKQDFTTIYNPIDTQRFYKADPKKIVPNTLLFVGTVCEKKGVRQLLQAMEIVVEKIPEVKLFLVGRDWHYLDGSSFTEEMKNMLSEDVKEKIEFVGVISNNFVSNWIEKAEICVFPSHMEAMPVAWLEALAMGKPVVASNIPPGREAIEHNVTGLLADPYDSYDLAEKIIWMLKHKELAIQMGDKARDSVLQKFDLNVLAKENKDYYKSILCDF